MSRRTLRCLRCGGTMELLRREFLQLGKTGWVLGDLDNLLTGGPGGQRHRPDGVSQLRQEL